MKIAVIGLGLIGGSLCKALKRAHPSQQICGWDIDASAVEKALMSGAIDAQCGISYIDADITFIALHPAAAIDFVKRYADSFKKGSIVTDVCGVKQTVCVQCEDALIDRGVYFVGGHPMAGKERWGFDNSHEAMFDGATYILTHTPRTDNTSLEIIEKTVKTLGCDVLITDAQRHDAMIAYTSQLAHIVSNGYIKSPSAVRQEGYTGGSFQDLTRVAYLDENLWTELFMYNRELLLKEMDLFLKNMEKYRFALEQGDSEYLKELLRQGREAKERLAFTKKSAKRKDNQS